MSLDRPLSPHFSLLEMLLSETAERIPALRAQQRNPPAAVVRNLEALAARCLEPMRVDVGVPLHVNSGYRCPDLNRLIRGSKSSQHMVGQAADLAPVFPDAHAAAQFHQRASGAALAEEGLALRADLAGPGLLFAWIALHLDAYDVDQLIHEYGRGPGRPAWVHVSSRGDGGGRRQILRYYTGRDGKVKVVPLTRRSALALCT